MTKQPKALYLADELAANWWPNAAAELRRLHEVNQMLIEIAQSVESILSNCDVNSGVCCCGDSIESHPDAMYCGHTSVDSGWYAADSLLKKARAAIEKAGEA